MTKLITANVYLTQSQQHILEDVLREKINNLEEDIASLSKQVKLFYKECDPNDNNTIVYFITLNCYRTHLKKAKKELKNLVTIQKQVKGAIQDKFDTTEIPFSAFNVLSFETL